MGTEVSHSSSNSSPRLRNRFRLFSLPSSCILAIFLFAQFWLLPTYLLQGSTSELKLSVHQRSILDSGLRKCIEFDAPLAYYSELDILARENSRWNNVSGQTETVVLRNATLFDGSTILAAAVDVIFAKGIITAISPTSNANSFGNATILNADGKFVTPGLVDMHSHHLVMTWPSLRATEDTNEVNDVFGPLTPFVRALDSIKPYDAATTMIRSGGVTTSLILPGSANIMGGEATIVKNVLRAGKDGEESVEEMLLEHGIPKSNRRRYMKMACGENPRRVYKHTRMGNAWIFRRHMQRAVELRTRQDDWCLAATVAQEKQDAAMISRLTASHGKETGGLPEELELESSVAILRGKVGVNVHCYEPEDFEDMLLHSKEFGFRIQAFHHALSAWKVPELIKASGDNITIATFADFALYKKEAYGANLYAGKILSEHGVPVAYKSDHSQESTNAKYLLFQAAVGHSFGLPEIKALQSVTSVPAKSLQQDHRIGYVRPGYDADLVVWDSHPLSVGATPLQVFVDGKATLDVEKVKASMPALEAPFNKESDQPRVRPMIETEEKERICTSIEKSGASFIVTGIVDSFLISSKEASQGEKTRNMTVVLEKGEVVCLGAFETCVSASNKHPIVHLSNGYLLPGLTAVSRTLGLQEISSESNTGDGTISANKDVSNPDIMVYAKYGVHLEGRGFDRARIGGVTRSVTTPLIQGGFMGGVSVAIKTSGKKTVLNGGITQSDVGLHIAIGQGSKSSESTPSISLAVSKLRQILSNNHGKDNIFGRAANGSLPLVIHTDNKYDIMQVIKVREDFSDLNLVIYGGAEAPAVASELAIAGIPIILTHNRGGPESFENKDLLIGPPLTPSAASVLAKANVAFGLAIESFEGESSIQNLIHEASWAAKYAGLSQRAAIDLVSAHIQSILGLQDPSHEDIVIWEGNPLEFGASVVVSIDGQDGSIGSCWPYSE